MGHVDKSWIVGYAMVLVLFDNKKLSNIKWWGRISVARPYVVVHKMQVTTIVGPALTRPLFHSWIVLIFYEKLDYIKESRPNM